MSSLLDGVVVLDLTRNVAGPFCTLALADLGADVIKVERVGSGDDTREWKPPTWNGMSTAYLSINRNKRGIAVDIDSPEGQNIIRRLAEKADVLVESFRPGSLAKRGLDYESIRQINPKIIYCSISAYGHDGPASHLPGYDPILQAYSGIMSITGEPGRPPVRTGPAINDMGTGMWAALGIVSALFHRMSTGQGHYIDASLLDTGVAYVSIHLAATAASGKPPGRVGSASPLIAPYEAFQTQDDYILLAAPNNNLFSRLCRLLGLDDLPNDDRFRTNSDRVANRPQLKELLEAKLKEKPAEHWEALFLENGMPCSRIKSLDQVLKDPQVLGRDLLMEFPGTPLEGLPLANLPLKIDGRRADPRYLPPAIGEHTDEVLQAYGFEPQQIEEWRRQGIVQ